MPSEIEQEVAPSTENALEISTPEVEVSVPKEVSPVKEKIQKNMEAFKEGALKTEPETLTFKPREKFKTTDFTSGEQKEYDIPTWAKPLLKDETTEKELVSLLEQASGLEFVKQSRASAQKERDSIKNEFTTIQKTIEDVRTTYQRGDIDAFLEKLAIPQERMLQWALDKVQYSQLPAEQQRVLDERQDAQRRAWSAEQQTKTLEQQFKEQSAQTRTTLLDNGLARPDVQAFASAYDARVGKTGAFKSEVIATGELAWIQSGNKVDLSPEQAIEQAMGKWKGFIPLPGTTTQVATGMEQIPQVPKATIIPNIAGRSQSPMKSKPRSIEDLKKIRDRAQA